MMRRRRADSPGDPAHDLAHVGDAHVGDAHPLPAGVTRLAGYRLMRRLGAGNRARVYLGHAGGATTFAEQTVALKVFEPHVAEASINVEIAALSVLTSPHIVRLLDVGSSEGEPRCLVLQRLGGGSVASLLARGNGLAAGSAVTVLVSAAYALADLHAAGFHHGALSPAALLLDDVGRPVLTGFGHAAPLAAGADAAWASRAHDYVHLGALCRAVFSGVDDAADDRATHDGAAHGSAVRGAAEDVAGWLEALPTTPRSERAGVADELEERLFGLARPRPVHTVPPTSDAPPPPATLPDAGRRPRQHDPHVGAAASEGHKHRAGWRAGVMAAAQRVFRSGGLPAIRAGLLTRLRARRRPLIVGCIVAGVLLLVPLALLPVPSSPDEGAQAQESTHTAVAGADPTDSPPDSPADSSPESPAPESPARGSIAGDDPVAATEALLAARRACLQARRLSCLDGVDAPGSPLQDDDRSAIARRISTTGTDAADTGAGGQDAAGTDIAGTGGYTVSLIQRTGGAALVALAPSTNDTDTNDTGTNDTDTGIPKPATALVIRGETGWRLREIFAN